MTSIFSLLLIKLIPLYLTIALGFAAGRIWGVDRESVGRIVFYILVPIIMFSGVLKAELTAATFLLPLLTYSVSCLMTVLFLKLGRRIWADAHANILACTAGTGNTGYFGLPVAMALFDEATVAIYILLILGTSLAESSVGFFVASCGKTSARESFVKVLKLPILHAFFAGLIFRYFSWELPPIGWEFIGNIRGTYIILGMMIIGIGMSGLKQLAIDKIFTAMAFSAKFIAWPLLMVLIVWIDRTSLQLYSEPIHHALLLISIVPMAANTVVIASILGIEPEKVATTVLLSYIIAIIYVPLMVALLVVS